MAAVSAWVGSLAVIALGLSAGAMLAEAAVLVPYWRSLPPDAFLTWYRDNASLLFDFFAPLESASAALAIAAAILHRIGRLSGAGLFAVSAVLSAAVLGFFPLYFQQVNESFAAGTLVPDRVAEELARWARWHWSRTAIGIGAFAAAAFAARR